MGCSIIKFNYAIHGYLHSLLTVHTFKTKTEVIGSISKSVLYTVIKIHLLLLCYYHEHSIVKRDLMSNKLT